MNVAATELIHWIFYIKKRNYLKQIDKRSLHNLSRFLLSNLWKGSLDRYWTKAVSLMRKRLEFKISLYKSKSASLSATEINLLQLGYIWKKKTKQHRLNIDQSWAFYEADCTTSCNFLFASGTNSSFEQKKFLDDLSFYAWTKILPYISDYSLLMFSQDRIYYSKHGFYS